MSRLDRTCGGVVGASARAILRPMRRLLHSPAVALLRAAHPRQATATAAGLALVAAVGGRPLREVALVAATALVGQSVQGWHNDVVDRAHDRRHDRAHKPLAADEVDPGSVVFTLTCAVLLLVPLSISSGVVAGGAYLLAVAVGLVGNVALRRGRWSWVPWACQFALYPTFLAQGGWGGEGSGAWPPPALTVLAALLGVLVHVLRSLPDLVGDHADGAASLPVRIALRTGATRLLRACSLLALLVGGGILIVARGAAWGG